ncbi:MAG: ribosomal subunit interface protein [Phycisphaerae bacterium]|nr:ribosomal subunit interface protein [Phycisphaerae bacterium]|tara:strand:- start:1099 stop:1395 length:297 start_codon:yes stop_codon:yes gene_type:complete
MQINVTHRHGSVDAAIEAHTRSKVEGLTKYFDRIEMVEIIFDHTKNLQEIELIIKLDQGEDILATGSSEELRTAVDQCMDRAIRQITDHKSKLRDDKH